MKTKALASYDQLILATKRGSYYGPVPKLLGLFARSSMTSFCEKLAERSNIAAEFHVWGEPRFCALPFRG